MIVAEGLAAAAMQLAVGREALDRRDLVRHRPATANMQARARRRAVEQHRAGAADAVLAAEMSAGQTELMTQKIGQGAAATRRPPRIRLRR